MRILGLDLGSRTLGIALSDSSESFAMAKETFRFDEEDYGAALDRALDYVEEYAIKTIVLGFPKHMNNDIGEKAKLSLEFKEALESYADVDVILMDERLTTVSALNTMAILGTNAKKRKANVDQMAAQTILQDYLDRKKNERND